MDDLEYKILYEDDFCSIAEADDTYNSVAVC